MKKFIIVSSFILLVSFRSDAHDHYKHQRTISFPDIPGYTTLKVDLHQHTVFSDGDVWPNIRVEEALKDGLDAISLTEHLEYQPHKGDIPHPDRNRTFVLATNSAKNKPLIVINGSEITRKMPPGHSNAIFLTDATKMLIPDSIEVFREAKRQGAFTFWNHPHWSGQRMDGSAQLTDMHKFLLKEKLLDGIEVVNDLSYSDEALQIGLDNNLTLIGSSDIHGLIDWNYDVPEGGHRPITLVFAKEKTEASLKEALLNKRTVVWFNNTLIGREEFLVPLINSSLTLEGTKYYGKTSILTVKMRNSSSTEYILENNSEYLFYDNTNIITLKANSVTTIEVKVMQNLPELQLKFKVLSAVTAPKTHPSITIPVTVK
ncbi:MAG: Sb-PDE family phosphodiesterase [Bacteriovoracaceae bacterium]|nr:Sb-PDE family phosphodiesterase [Bacteroidota bacterium]